MKITSDGKEVLDSGTVIAFRESITFHLTDGPPPFVITVTFEERTADDGTKTPAIESSTDGPTNLNLKLLNFSNSLGTGTIEPMEMGHVNNRKLYLQFRAYKLDKAPHHLIYTWFLGEAINA